MSSKAKNTKNNDSLSKDLAKGSKKSKFPTYRISPSTGHVIVNFQMPRVQINTLPRDYEKQGDLTRDTFRNHVLLAARETGDVSQQIEALHIKPGALISKDRLPTVIADLSVIMGDVFRDKTSAENFLSRELSPVSGKRWVDAIAAGEIATFLVSLNEMKYGTRG